MIFDWLNFSGLLPDCVPPLQTSAAVCAGHGAGGHAAALSMVRSASFEQNPLMLAYFSAGRLCIVFCLYQANSERHVQDRSVSALPSLHDSFR